MGWAVLLLALGACSATYETAHLQVEPHFEYPICEGNLQAWEAQIEAHEDRLGFFLHPPVRLDLWAPPDWPKQAKMKCGSKNFLGCYNRVSHTISSEYVDGTIGHELVHAIVRAPASSDYFLNEGLAEALSKPTQFWSQPPTLGLGKHDVKYQAAGHFVRWLIETRGMKCAEGALWSSGKKVEADFSASCEISFDEAVSEYSETAPWFYPALTTCTDNVLPVGTGEPVMLEFDCDDADVRAYGPSLHVRRTIQIEQPGVYHVWTSAWALMLGSCHREQVLEAPDFYTGITTAVPPHWAMESRSYPGGRVHVLQLPAGAIELTVVGPWDEETQQVIVEPVPPDLPVAVR